MTKAAKTAVTPTREEDFAGWYQSVIRAADMADNAPVRGCMIMKPWGFGIWEQIRDRLDRRIKETGHLNVYFPLFIPLSFIQKEAAHVEGFAKEMAVVTHHRLKMGADGKLELDGKLEEPLIVRPTSETIIGEAMADWIKSWRDLPLLINQWANVVRWEMRPRLFLRTSEFLWQEGHTAHASAEEAMAETRKMLEEYRHLVEDILAIPVIQGVKPESERFPGADETFTIEAMMQDGKALQAGTSHFLGQNFARAANIRFQSRDGEHQLAWTTSWGLSTRTIGALIMTHGDDNGLRLPPRMAPHQVVIVPILRTEQDAAVVMPAAEALLAQLKAQQAWDEPVRAHLDRRDVASADKRWDWIKKGVPLILELGPRDVAGGTVAVQRRDALPDGKAILPQDVLVLGVPGMLQSLQERLWQRAFDYRKEFLRSDFKEVGSLQAWFADEEDLFVGFARAPWCAETGTEEVLKEFGVTIRCIPLDQPEVVGRCVLTGKPGKVEAIFARAY